MFALFFGLLKGKLLFLGTTNIPLLATLLVLGTTGFLVTGTIQANGDDEDRPAAGVVVTPLETQACVNALIAQTEALLELDALAADTSLQLRQLRNAARERAEDQRKLIDETALRTQYNSFATRIPIVLAAARRQVNAVLDLAPCRDGDPTTTVNVNVEALRAQYAAIVASFGQTMSAILTDAQGAFDQLVATAQPRPQRKDDDDEEDDD